MKSKLDVRPLLIASISTNKKIKKDINNLYLKYKEKAYCLAKNSVMYDSYFLTSGNIDREIYCKRILGIILLSSEDSKIYDEFINILVKGYYCIYKYIEKIDKLEMEKCIKNMHKLNILNKSLSTEEYNSRILIALIFSLSLEKEVNEEDEYYKTVIDLLNKSVNILGKRKNVFSFSKLSKIEKAKADKILERLLQYLDGGNFNILDELIDMCCKHEEISSFANTILNIVGTEDIDISVIAHENYLSTKDIKTCVYLYYLIYKNQNRAEMAKILFVSMLLKAIIKDYKKTKNYYFKNNKETLYVELDNYKKTINNLKLKNDKLAKQNKGIKKEIFKLKSEYKNTIERENILLKKHILELEEKIKTCEKRNEILGNEIVPQKINSNDLNNSLEIEDEKLCIKGKILIIGGMPSWQKKIQEAFHNTSFMFLDGFKNNFKVNQLGQFNIVLFYNNYMKHPVSVKIVDYCKKNNIKYDYIKSTSIELLKKEVKNKIEGRNSICKN